MGREINEREGEGRREEEGKTCYGHLPTPSDGCSHYILQTHTHRNFLKDKMTMWMLHKRKKNAVYTCNGVTPSHKEG